MQFVTQEFAGAYGGSTPPLPALAREAQQDIVRDGPSQEFISAPMWMGTRNWEAAETNRLNQAHWRNADDSDINRWLRERLATLRARATYECRMNPTMSGVEKTLVDDVVGPDGPMLQVQSSDPEYNAAFERVWREWFRAPTFRPNVSGAAWLKLCVRNMPRCGEYLAIKKTDPTADGSVSLRLKPVHPRRLATPPDQIGNPRIQMGIEFDENDRPVRYWIAEPDGSGFGTTYVPYPPDLIIHEFVLDEEGQARGFPWMAPSLPSAADLRDFDEKVQDAATQMCDQSAMLYTDSPDVNTWQAPESTNVERRTYKMAPPGWKPWVYPATAPPAQYPDYRKERHRDIGRPINMPGMFVRLDASRYNYSSARMDSQGWTRTVDGLQCWLFGTPESVGMLTSLAFDVAAEARFKEPALRRKPADVVLVWTSEPRPHVDPSKEADADTVNLENGTTDLITVLAKNGTTLSRHVRNLKVSRQAFIDEDLPMPAWMNGGPATASTPEARLAREQKAAAEAQQEAGSNGD